MRIPNETETACLIYSVLQEHSVLDGPLPHNFCIAEQRESKMFVLLGDQVARQDISVYLICLTAKMSDHSTSLLGWGLSGLFKVTGLVADLGLYPRPPNS